MPDANDVIRVIAATVTIVVIAFVTAVGFALIEPIYWNVINPAELAALGWGTPHDTLLLFAGLGFIGLTMVVILWLVFAPVREDVRQDIGGPRI